MAEKQLPTIPQESPFQDSYPDFSPYCHTKAIAAILATQIPNMNKSTICFLGNQSNDKKKFKKEKRKKSMKRKVEGNFPNPITKNNQYIRKLLTIQQHWRRVRPKWAKRGHWRVH